MTRERLPEDGVTYYAFADAATGGGRDKASIGLAHSQKIGGREVAVLDCVRWWAPPFDPNKVIADMSDLCSRYRVRTVVGDAYAGGQDGGFVQSAFDKCGVKYEISELNKSELYLEFLPLVNSNTVWLVNQPEMLKELRGLERRRGTSGKDRVDHRPGAHDDLANAAAGCLVTVAARTRKAKGFVLVGSYTKSTTGEEWTGGAFGQEQVAASARSQRDGGDAAIHPHERIERVGPPELSDRKRRAWGGV